MRTYRLHLPAGGPPSGLVVNLHAAGATGADQAALTHYDAVGDAYGFAVVYPDGIDYSWADGRGASVPDRQGVDDVGFISTLVDRLVAENGIPRGRVYATGLSAGGFMANRLACDRADLFAAIAPVAGTLGTNVGCNPVRPVSVLATYGTADPVVPFNGGPMTGRGGGSTVVSGPAMVDRWRQIKAARLRLTRCCPVPGTAPKPTASPRTGVLRAPRWCSCGSTVAGTPGRECPRFFPCSRSVRPAGPSTPPTPPLSSSPLTADRSPLTDRVVGYACPVAVRVDTFCGVGM